MAVQAWYLPILSVLAKVTVVDPTAPSFHITHQIPPSIPVVSPITYSLHLPLLLILSVPDFAGGLGDGGHESYV